MASDKDFVTGFDLGRHGGDFTAIRIPLWAGKHDVDKMSAEHKANALALCRQKVEDAQNDLDDCEKWQARRRERLEEIVEEYQFWVQIFEERL